MVPSGSFRYTALEEVIYGQPVGQSLASRVERMGAKRVFLIVSGTLNRETDEVEKIISALGERFAGLFDKMPAHSPRDAVVAAARLAREAKADLLVTFGGGSVTDGGKVVQICLQHNVAKVEDLEKFHISTSPDGKTHRPRFEAPQVRQISIPTTLSGGEFNSLGGCTDPRTKLKQGYSHPLLVPIIIILDPAPTVHTPQWLWLSTGIRAIDHAVEGLCSPQANPYCDAAALHALRLLSAGLPRVKADPTDLEARMQCQIGSWLSMTTIIGGIPMGASHAIGHTLGGTCNVPHGYTSCITLPAVMRWNASGSRRAQNLIAEAMGRPGVEASEVLHGFIKELGLPRTLEEVGVHSDQFELIAKNTMHDRSIHTNPRRIRGPEEIVEILKTVA